MKNIIYIFIAILSITSYSCSEDEFLEENPSGLFTADNSFNTYDQFISAENFLYSHYRSTFYIGADRPFDFLYGTDYAHNSSGNNSRFARYAAQLDPTSETVKWYWERNYKMIANANTILSRLEGSELTDEQKLQSEAVAKFFRGHAYRTLTYLYGGIPIILEEVSSAKTDFVRASRLESLTQSISDLEFAASNLPSINQVENGKVTNTVANHLLAEVYIAAGEYDKSINAATAVINDPNMKLMTQRFGSLKDKPGDVYWDLFRVGNQNRSSGNTEGIFVIQFEVDLPGGGQSSTNRTGYLAERNHAARLRDMKRHDDINTKAGFLWPADDMIGGRGIGWMIPTYFFTNTIWQDASGNIDLDDIRNSKYNLPRSFAINKEGATYPLGTVLDCETNPEAAASLASTGLWWKNCFPYPTKVTTPGQHPEALIKNSKTGELFGSAGTTYTDWYDMRLGETYLLRAEAHLMKNSKQNAANDINELRTRANASLISAGDIDIDFILDERMRELGFEETRRLTLMRLGKLYERVEAHNLYNKGDIQPHHELFPIPQREIEANIDAVLEQNPGYN